MTKAPLTRGMQITLAMLVCVTVASSAAAQEAAQPKRVGLVGSGSPTAAQPYVAVVRDALQEFGWVEGRNLVLEQLMYRDLRVLCG